MAAPSELARIVEALLFLSPDPVAVNDLAEAAECGADELADALAARGIGARGYYRTPAHRQPAMARWAPPEGTLPGTEEAARTNLALPMGPELRDRDVAEVVEACTAVLAPA